VISAVVMPCGCSITVLSTGVFRLNPGKACRIEIQIIDKRVDEADRIVAMNVVIDPRWQKLGLVAITAFNVVHATILANRLAKRNPRLPGKSRFHTVWRVFERTVHRAALLPNLVVACFADRRIGLTGPPRQRRPGPAS
jgi:hypothetical protein